MPDRLFPVATLSLASVRALLEPHRPPCLSLYMPTHRNVPANLVDVHQFRRLVDSLEAGLLLKHHRDEADRLLEPFHRLDANATFWQHTLDGLAVLSSDGKAEVFRVQHPFQPLALSSDRFYTMPLVRAAAAIGRFDVLALSSREARVYEGTTDQLDPFDLGDASASGSQGTLERLDFIDEDTFQAHRVRQRSGPMGSVHGGFGSKSDDIDADTERFFREVDRIVVERVSNRSHLPLLLVAISEHASLFRKISGNRLLLDEGIASDPKMLEGPDLVPLVRSIAKGDRRSRIARLVTVFSRARDEGRGAGDLSDIARAAVAGRVATLLVEQDRLEPGKLDRTSGAIAWGADLETKSGIELAGDLVGILAEEVLLRDGEIVSLRPIEMPTETGVAAIYRY
jgi:hypothetical protein